MLHVPSIFQQKPIEDDQLKLSGLYPWIFEIFYTSQAFFMETWFYYLPFCA